jgi:hypothetical protein
MAPELPDVVDQMSGAYEKWWTEVLPHVHRKAKDPRWSQEYQPPPK